MATATKNIGSVTMPAGTYWVGDPCYSVPDEDWMPWLEAADYRTERRFLLADLHGQPVLGIGTAHGDGVFKSNMTFSFPVDSGLIGLVPVSIGIPGAQYGLDSKSRTQVAFDAPFTCSYEEDGGVIVLGHIEIETDPEEDGDDW